MIFEVVVEDYVLQEGECFYIKDDYDTMDGYEFKNKPIYEIGEEVAIYLYKDKIDFHTNETEEDDEEEIDDNYTIVKGKVQYKIYKDGDLYEVLE